MVDPIIKTIVGILALAGLGYVFISRMKESKHQHSQIIQEPICRHRYPSYGAQVCFYCHKPKEADKPKQEPIAVEEIKL